jgi:hypothetical protein
MTEWFQNAVERAVFAVSAVPSGESSESTLIVAVHGPRGSGKTSVVLNSIQQQCSKEPELFTQPSLRERKASGLAGRKREREPEEGATQAPELPCDVGMVYVSCQAIGDDTRKLHRTVLSLLESELDSCGKGSRQLSDGRGVGSLPGFGEHLWRMIRRHGEKSAGARQGTTSGVKGAGSFRLHIVLDDADYLSLEVLWDVERWGAAFKAASRSSGSESVGSIGLCLWTLSLRLLEFPRSKVWRLVAPAPSPTEIASWYCGSSKREELGGDGNAPAPSLVRERERALLFYLTQKPCKNSLVAKNPKLLANTVQTIMLPRLLKESPAAIVETAGTASAPPRNPLQAADYLQVWDAEVKNEQTSGPSLTRLLSVLPASAKVLYVTCFYCGSVPQSRDQGVLFSEEARRHLSASEKRAQHKVTEKGDGTLLSTAHPVPMSRLNRCYEAICCIVREAGSDGAAGAGAGSGSTGPPSPESFVLGEAKDFLLPFSLALHHLKTFESWGLIQWLLNNQNVFYSHIAVTQADAIAASLNLKLHLLIPSVC